MAHSLLHYDNIHINTPGMKPTFSICILLIIAITGCKKSEDEKDCTRQLAGNYKAIVYDHKTLTEEDQEISVSLTTPYTSNKILLCGVNTDDTLVALINCEGSTISFPAQDEIPTLNSGKGSFSLSPKKLTYMLITEEPGYSPDTVTFVLTQR